MTAEERNRRLKALGYQLVRNYPCPIRQRVMPYATVPANGNSGSTCVHENLAGVEKRILLAENIRRWQK